MSLLSVRGTALRGLIDGARDGRVARRPRGQRDGKKHGNGIALDDGRQCGRKAPRQVAPHTRDADAGVEDESRTEIERHVRRAGDDRSDDLS